MVKKVKIKELKETLVGKIVPQQDSGNVGMYLHDELGKKDKRMNSGPGVDWPYCDTEFKTRNRGSTASHTIGTMTIKDIVQTPYKKSPIREKLRTQRRVEFDNTFNVVTSDEIVDLDIDFIQESIESAYEEARKIIIDEYEGSYDSSDDYLTIVGKVNGPHFEHKTGNTYAFRIGNTTMKKYLKSARAYTKFKTLFTEIDEND